MIKKFKNSISLILPILLISIFLTNNVFAQEENFKELFKTAASHSLNGEYRQSITIYEEILKNQPNNNLALKMKGLALSNLDEHTSALKQFHQALKVSPNDVTTLTAMGVSFGSLGEYREALIYFNKAKNQDPNSEVIKNYMDFIEEFVSKYPYKPTSKTQGFQNDQGDLPKWMTDSTKWWTDIEITDIEFFNSLEYMIEKKIIKVPKEQIVENVNELKMMSSIRSELESWSNEPSSKRLFFKNVQW